MVESVPQTLQEFFDSPLAKRARYNLSASAAEPMTQAELFGFEPGSLEALQSISLDYPHRHGSVELIAQVASRYRGIDETGIVLTSGLDDGLGMLFLSLVAPGDRVVVLTPCYPPHLQLPRWRGAQTVPWTARPENGWIPDLDELRTLTAQPTRLVIATFPQNPAGFMPDRAYTDALIDMLAERGITLVSDEIYAGLPSGTAGEAINLAADNDCVISMHGLSKTCGLPALRVGWIASRDVRSLDAIRKVRNLFNCYLPEPIDFMARLALRHESAIVARSSAIANQNTRHAKRFFARHGNLFDWRAPSTGVLSFPRWLGPGGTKFLSDRLLREAAITFAPSLCFEAGDQHLRLSVARRSLEPGLEALEEFLSDAVVSGC